jgi:hypothetical protein
MSERDIEKKIFELNRPIFDSKNSIHVEINDLVKQITESMNNGGKLEDPDNRGKLEKINELVRNLL